MAVTLLPSLLAADFSDLAGDIHAAEEAGIDHFHFDVMDGAFVPNISFGMPVIKSIRKVSNSFFDVHMMVEEPSRYFREMRDAGADAVTIHIEAERHVDRALSEIHALNMKAGIALNPATPVSVLENILPLLDIVLIMLVNPGFGGQELIPYTLDKVKAVKEMASGSGCHARIAVDGGIKLSNILEVMDAGADYIIAGSSIFSPKDQIRDNIRRFHSIM